MQKQSVIAGGMFGLIAFVGGMYMIGGDERKPGEATQAPVTTHDAMGGGATSDAGVSRDLAKGAIAAFVVQKVRREIPPNTFADSTAKERSLSEWKGRVVLVNLWATWCGPCKKEMPDLAKLEAELGGADFEVVAISLDRKGPEASRAFLDENNAKALKLYTDPTAKLLDGFGAVGMPATILIGRDGKEIGRLLGPADWASPEAKALIKAAIAEKALASG